MSLYLKCCLAIVAILFSFVATCQVQFSTGTSYLKGSGYYDNHSYLLGGNVSMKYIYKDKYLIGITGRMYQAHTEAYERYNTSDKEQNLTTTFEIIFNKSQRLKPYLGIDGGVSQTSHMVNYVRASENFVIIALKGGADYSLGQSTGLFGQLQYNYTGGDASSANVPDVYNHILAEPIGKFWTLDFGIFVRLYVRTK